LLFGGRVAHRSLHHRAAGPDQHAAIDFGFSFGFGFGIGI
jgi:hypothetical protein